MKVLVVARSTTAHTLSGGMEAAYERLIPALASRDIRVSLLTTSAEARMENAHFENMWCIPTRSPGRYSSTWWRETRKEGPWTEWRPDVILSISRAAASMVHRNIPIVAQCHGTAAAEVKSSLRTRTAREFAKVPLNIARTMSERKFYNGISHTVAIGEAVAKQLTSAPISLPVARLAVIPNGIDTTLWVHNAVAGRTVRDALNISTSAHVGLIASRLHKQKGVDLAVDALRLMPPDTHLIICGDGPERRALEAQASSLGVLDRVSFTGRLSADDLRAYFSAADLLLLPTRREEGLPLSLMEAAANGLPVITSQSAQVPQDLLSITAVCSNAPADIAALWASAPSRFRSSRLPRRYERDTTAALLEQILVQKGI